MTTGMCRGCGVQRQVPDEGTKQLFAGSKIAFVQVAEPCTWRQPGMARACGARVVRLELAQCDEGEPELV